MNDDFSELETGSSCYAISSATSIYSYKNNTRSTYTQIGGKWLKTQQSTYNTIPTSSICFSYADITAINSKAEYAPIYEFIAFCLLLCSVGLFIKFIFRILGGVYARKV